MNNSKDMSLINHLEELRWRILKSLASILVMAILTFNFADYLVYTPDLRIETPEYLKILNNPNDPKVKSVMELLYKSKLGTLVYKINHGHG